MNPINLDFENDPLPKTATHFGKPQVKLDPVTGNNSCYFDGESYMQFPSMPLGSSPFCMEVFYRPETLREDRGVFGSTGYRLALRQDRFINTQSFWLNFPSSNNQIRESVEYDGTDFCSKEHYFGVSRDGNQFTMRFDDHVILREYSHDYWEFSIMLGAYYSSLYAFKGFIRQFRFATDAKDITQQLSHSLF